MKSFSTFSQATVTHMGTLAHTCLAPGQRGKVLAAFSNAIYLLSDGAELFWIVSGNAPMHRRALKIFPPLSGPQAGSPFYIEDQRLMIDPGFAFDMNNALLWHAPQADRKNTIEIAGIRERVQALFSNLDLSQARGFGCFLRDILPLSQIASSCLPPESADPILAFAQPVVLGMARACLENHRSQITQNADALIGLGAGLTPSGDDFLGGMLFCIKSLRTVFPNSNFFDPEISVKNLGLRTHLISFTLLKDLAGGHAIAPLHHIINGVLSGESPERIYPFVSQLTQIGHSTGWDLLTGFFTGLLTIHRNSDSAFLFRTTRNIKAWKGN